MENIFNREEFLARLIVPQLLGQKVLDLGAGDGKLAFEIKKNTNKNLTLVDIEKSTENNLPFSFWDSKKIPFAAKSFDSMIISFMIHYNKNPDAVLSEAKRVTKERIIILEDCLDSQLGKIKYRLANFYGHRYNLKNLPKHYYSEKQWRNIFEKADLKIIKTIKFKTKNWQHALFVLNV